LNIEFALYRCKDQAGALDGMIHAREYVFSLPSL
jgi:hypothetical protein